MIAGLKPSVETMVAAGAAIITGAAVYLMPVDLLQNAVVASGLPAILPPLDPPLGGRAQIGLALVAAGFAFGLVALLVRLFLGKPKAKPVRVSRAPEPAVEEPIAPRLRWRDRHPDAPARAPLSIGREIGVPSAQVPQAFGGDLPAWDEASVVAPEPVVEPEQAPDPEPEAAADIARDPVQVAPESADRAPVADAAQPLPSHPAWLDTDVPQPDEPAEPSLADLLARLEAAMARRVPVMAEAAVPPTETQAEAAPNGGGSDDRLRSALESLKRFAPGRG